MTSHIRSYLKGMGSGIVLMLFLLWLYPELAPRKNESRDAVPFDLPTLERIRRAGVVRVGFANEAPFAYVDSKTGELTGESPEIARVILKRLGVKRIEGVLTEFGSLIPGLKANRFDIIAAGMYVTPPRCGEIAFSNPTYGIGEAFIVRKGNPRKLHSYRDVAEKKQARLAVVAGAIEREYAGKSGIPGERIKIMPDAPSALEAVAAGRVDAYAATSLTVNDLLARAHNTRLERAHPFEDPVIDSKTVRGYGAFGFRRQDERLLAAFNQELEQFVGGEEHLDLVQGFGFTATEMPGEVTSLDLCRG